MAGPTWIEIVLAGVCSCSQILPEIQFVARLTSPQPYAKPLPPAGNDCEAWNPHGGMPLPGGIPLPEYQVQCGTEFPSADANVEAGPIVRARYAMASRTTTRNRR